MSPTEAAVEHWRLQRELKAARETGDDERIRRARDALQKFVERRDENHRK